MSVIKWRKTSGVPYQAARGKKAQVIWTAEKSSFNESLMCKAGSNKGGLVSSFYATLKIINCNVIQHATSMGLQ